MKLEPVMLMMLECTLEVMEGWVNESITLTEVSPIEFWR
jgi:hypothetical protein